MKAHISSSLATFFRDRFLKKFNLEQDRNDFDEKLVVFGCYNSRDMARIVNHRAEILLIWAGTDVLNVDNLLILNDFSNIKHIAQSRDIYLKLLEFNFDPEYRQISLTDFDYWKPVPLGDKIYIYTSQTRPDKYGKEMYEDIMSYYGSERFIVSNYNVYTQEEMRDIIYPQIKFALRLTPFDGLSESVLELGLMGRMVIHNDDIPNCLHYKDYRQIFNYIEYLSDIDFDPYILSSKIYKSLKNITL